MSGLNNVVESFLGTEDRAPSLIPAAESNTTLGEAQTVSSEAYAHRLFEADLASRWGTDRRTTFSRGSDRVASSSTASTHVSAAADDMLGVAEHLRWSVFEGVLAFSNLGLPGAAVTSSKWPKHSMRLRTLVSSLFTGAAERGRTLTGILFNEVGNLSDPVGFVGRQKLHDVLKEAFRHSGGEDPRMLWSAGETMAAFRPAEKVECLPSLVGMPGSTRGGRSNASRCPVLQSTGLASFICSTSTSLSQEDVRSDLHGRYISAKQSSDPSCGIVRRRITA